MGDIPMQVSETCCEDLQQVRGGHDKRTDLQSSHKKHTRTFRWSQNIQANFAGGIYVCWEQHGDPRQLVLTGHLVFPPAFSPLGSSASPRYLSAGPSSVPPDVSLHSPNKKAVLMSTDIITVYERQYLLKKPSTLTEDSVFTMNRNRESGCISLKFVTFHPCNNPQARYLALELQFSLPQDRPFFFFFFNRAVTVVTRTRM